MGYRSLHSAFHFPQGRVFPGQCTFLITDALAADGSFLLHHFITSALQVGPSGTSSTEQLGTAMRRQLHLHSKPDSTSSASSAPGPDYQVILVGLAQIFNHYLLVARKLGVNLMTYREQNRFVFVDGLSRLASVSDSRTLVPGQANVPTTATTPSYVLPTFHHGDQSSQRYLDDLLREILSFLEQAQSSDSTQASSDKPSSPLTPCLIFDDISVLWNLGMDANAIVQFLLACKLAVESRDGALIILVHADTCLASQQQSTDRTTTDTNAFSKGYDYFIRSLQRLATIVLQTEPLTSGHSRDVHGQLSMLRGPQCYSKEFKSRVLHYKIYDNNAEFFAPGFSSAVL
ncbi:Elongator subunit elp6 [Dispira parvispora]|uniref:Elongator subunit elp6 n=1 Tax=Dispira parvispora TaxID=1520584 RepID=A0A9W8E531_9FUNG|nr:Elongator subunit elp6 [Dispira parvispora]